jgi:hypothetical protein
MTYYYKLESGAYSDYRESWYSHAQKLSYRQISAMLREALPAVVQRMRNWNKNKMDEQR